MPRDRTIECLRHCSRFSVIRNEACNATFKRDEPYQRHVQLHHKLKVSIRRVNGEVHETYSDMSEDAWLRYRQDAANRQGQRAPKRRRIREARARQASSATSRQPAAPYGGAPAAPTGGIPAAHRRCPVAAHPVHRYVTATLRGRNVFTSPVSHDAVRGLHQNRRAIARLLRNRPVQNNGRI